MSMSRYVWCEDCAEMVNTSWTDEGIGVYEYWGARGRQTVWCEGCSQCDGQNLLDEEPDGEEDTD